MQRSNATCRTNGLVVLVALVGLVFGTAGPAAAQTEPTVGAGAGPGLEYPSQQFAECGPFGNPLLDAPYGVAFSDDTFVLSQTGTYDSVNPTTNITIASYAGPIEITITTGPVVQAPQGAADGGCQSVAGTPSPVVLSPVKITHVEITGQALLLPLTSGTSKGGVYCNNVKPGGTYTRVQSAVVFTFTVDCDITGNVTPFTGAVQNVPVRHVIEGTQVPCLGEFVPDPCVVQGPDASSVLATTFEAVGPSPV